MEAEFVRDDEYVAARRIRNEDSDQWRSRAIRAQEDLGEADEYAKSLEARIRELEKELACHRDYEDNRGGKRARYDSPYEGESGTNSPAPRRRGPQPPHQPSTQEPSYARVVQEPAPVRTQEDVQMEDGEVGRFPPLPTPQPPLEVTRGPVGVPRGANWRPAPQLRPTQARRGGFGGHPTPRLPPLVISSVEELEQHLEAANIQGNELALTRMRAYVRDAQNVPRENRSPMQNAALLKWKTPAWVPIEARPPVRGGDQNAPAGVNTPRLTDPAEDWARWMWRYPREAETRPGIRRGRDGMSLSSIRGLLLVTGRAPRGVGVIRERNTFMTRAAELMATPGRYRRLVEERRMTIAAIPRITTAQPSENVTVEDVAAMFAADGVTIAQVSDAFEWGRSMLLNLSNGVDASRRTEAMQALANAQRGTSQEEQDRPRPIEPRWWYPPQWTEGTATTPLDTQQQHAQQVHATIVPFAPMDQRSGTLRTSAPERAQIPESATAVAYDGWTGTQTIYLRPKKKKRKPRSKKKEDTDESSDVDDGGWTREREAKLATLQAKPQEESQAETSGGAQEEEEPANGTVEDEEME
jgi:hypothetical protein